MNIKTIYAELTRKAKQDLEAAPDNPSEQAKRLYEEFRERAREDFRTLKPAPPKED